MTLRCAYIASPYPAVSHTFIRREVVALRAMGVDVETISIRRAPADPALAAVDRQEHARTHALLPTTPGRIARAHARALLRSPRAYISTLRTALALTPGGGRGTLWQLFYFVEAILTWAWLERRGIRHLHAHHANVPCDVSLLTCAYGNAAGDEQTWTWSFTFHGPTELYDVAPHRLPEKVRRADLVAVTSDHVRSQLMAHVEPEEWPKLRVVRGGVDVDEFAPEGPRDRNEGLRILNVARVAAAKGQLDLIEAMTLLRDRGVASSAVIVGDGPLRPAVAAAIRREELDDRVSLAGAVPPDDVRRYYADADVFCLPSFAEGLPNVLIEAMAMALPVVTTRVFGIPELVEDQVSGYAVAPARPDLLAEGLERLAADPALRRRMGSAGRRRVAADYTIERTAREMSELFAEVAAGVGRRPA